MGTLAAMMARTARLGRVDWIGIRPTRRGAVETPGKAILRFDGFEGDHAPEGKRSVTLIQAEHLPVIAALLARDAIDPGLLRRNVVIEGLNLLGFRKARLRIGEALIEVTGPCPPCSRMEEVLGPGGYTAMRGHGGVYATVLKEGLVSLGVTVAPEAGEGTA